jgi:hypothetical protein
MTIVTRKSLIPLMGVLLLLAGACKRELPESLEATHVRYQINYLEKMAGDVPTNLLPRYMDAYYTSEYVYTEIAGFFSQFRLVYVADLRKRKVNSILTFFGNKVYSLGHAGHLPAGVVPIAGLELGATNDTMTIGGLLSEKILAETGGEQYPIWFTREFNIRRANISTPYRSVDYPLTDFRVQLSKLKMHATCMSSESSTLATSLLDPPEGYKEVEHEAMEEIINSLFTKE